MVQSAFFMEVKPGAQGTCTNTSAELIDLRCLHRIASQPFLSDVTMSIEEKDGDLSVSQHSLSTEVSFCQKECAACALSAAFRNAFKRLEIGECSRMVFYLPNKCIPAFAWLLRVFAQLIDLHSSIHHTGEKVLVPAAAVGIRGTASGATAGRRSRRSSGAPRGPGCTSGRSTGTPRCARPPRGATSSRCSRAHGPCLRGRCLMF